MGQINSAMIRDEQALLQRGVDWWTRWSQPGEPDPKPRVAFSVRNVELGNGLHIHTAEYTRTDKAAARQKRTDGTDALPLVAMHGFGTGLGIYSAALPALAEQWRGPLYAIDSLGCGLSSRPHWHLGKGQSCKVAEVEAFFVDGIERWRSAMGLQRMVLMGHSVGGYLAVAYAEKYPQHIERLVLVSAVGVPPPPARLAEVHASMPWLARTVFGAWRAGFSPFTVAKLGLGSTVARRYVDMRFSDASWVAKPELVAYLADNWTGDSNSAGGYAHATLLQPGGVGELAYAREPLGAERIPALRSGLRISALYGDRDWMDWRNMAAVKADVQKRAKAGALGAHAGPRIEILHVADANHNVQVDNPLGFVDAVLASCNGGEAAHGQTFGRKYYAQDRAGEGARDVLV